MMTLSIFKGIILFLSLIKQRFLFLEVLLIHNAILVDTGLYLFTVKHHTICQFLGPFNFVLVSGVEALFILAFFINFSCSVSLWFIFLTLHLAVLNLSDITVLLSFLCVLFEFDKSVLHIQF